MPSHQNQLRMQEMHENDRKGTELLDENILTCIWLYKIMYLTLQTDSKCLIQVFLNHCIYRFLQGIGYILKCSILASLAPANAVWWSFLLQHEFNTLQVWNDRNAFLQIFQNLSIDGSENNDDSLLDA